MSLRSLSRRPTRRTAPVTRPSLLSLEDRLTPSGLPPAWLSRGAGGGGSLFSPQFSPFNANELYVSSDMSQLFHSTNAGDSWEALDHRQIQGNHESRMQFTEDPNLLYCLDYANVNGLDLVRPSKSTNGGQTWQPITTDPTGGELANLFADPTNHNRLLV